MLRIVVIWLVTVATLLLASAVMPGVQLKDVAAALSAAALIGLVNALLWPLAMRLLLPITVLTLGLGALVVNGAVVLLVSAIDPGLRVDGLFTAIVLALVLTIANAAVASLLAIDDDGFYYRNVVRRGARRARWRVRRGRVLVTGRSRSRSWSAPQPGRCPPVVRSSWVDCLPCR